MRRNGDERGMGVWGGGGEGREVRVVRGGKEGEGCKVLISRYTR